MPAYVVTGNLGGGKSLICVGKINEYLQQGRPVATNLNITLSQLVLWNNKTARLVRIPDHPNARDLALLGRGNRTKNERKNGLLVFDECGTWFNSRTWGDKERQALINWLLHSRKKGWDVFFIIQDIGMIDKQVRLSLAEHTVFCKRLDRLAIPIIGTFLSLFGIRLPLPRVHCGLVRYGTRDTALIVDRWIYTGNDLMSAYDTNQEFSDDYPHGSFSYLPPWYTRGWRRQLYKMRDYMKLSRIYWKKFRSPFAFLTGAALVAIFHFSTQPATAQNEVAASADYDFSKLHHAKIQTFSQFPGRPVSFVLDVSGESIPSNSLDASGVTYSGNSSKLVLSYRGQNATIYK